MYIKDVSFFRKELLSNIMLMQELPVKLRRRKRIDLIGGGIDERVRLARAPRARFAAGAEVRPEVDLRERLEGERCHVIGERQVLKRALLIKSGEN